jgi:ADP-heptose:LPS heptosyltransferase
LSGIAANIFDRRPTIPGADEIRNILVIKFFGMGSIIQTTAALQVLRSAFPHARIAFLSFAVHKDLLERYDVIDEVLTIEHTSAVHFLRDTFRVLLHLLNRRFDVSFDFEFFSKFSTLLATCSSCRVRAGFQLPTAWRRWNLTHDVELSKSRHVRLAFCEQVFLLTGMREVPPILAPAVRPEDIRSMLRKTGSDAGSFIVINPNAGKTFLERRWKPGQFAALVSSLAGEVRSVFYFTGSREEREYVQGVIDRTSCKERCVNLSGLLTVPELAALLMNCDLFISNDSGPLHLADVAGARAIGLYGPESPLFYGPGGPNVRTIYKSIECSPCMNVYAAKLFTCPYNARCMEEIRVGEVKEEILQHLAVH